MSTQSHSTILAAIDFSPITDEVIETAAGIARAYDATLVLMHAYFVAPLPYGGPFAWAMDEVRAAAQASLDKALERAQTRYPRCKALLCGGDPRIEILAAAKQEHATLIVLGGHSAGTLSQLMLGSVADRVVRSATVPVITVPGRLQADGAAAPQPGV